jgi:hypothetical protein
MRSTSIESYRKLSPSITQQQRNKILKLLENWPYLTFSDRDISFATHLPINIVESRRNDLAKRGLIVFAGEIHDSETNRTVRSWRIKKNE